MSPPHPDPNTRPEVDQPPSPSSDRSILNHPLDVRDRLVRILYRREARFTVGERDDILALFDEMTEEVVRTRLECAMLRGRLTERETSRPTSYAAAASRSTTDPTTRASTTSAHPPQPTQAPPRPDPPQADSRRPRKRRRRRPPKAYKVVISHTHEDGTSDPEATKRHLLQAVNPVSSGIRIKSMRSTRGGKVLIETHS